jgi:hypothetical protein
MRQRLNILLTLHTSPPHATATVNQEHKKKELKYKSKLLGVGESMQGEGNFNDERLGKICVYSFAVPSIDST